MILIVVLMMGIDLSSFGESHMSILFSAVVTAVVATSVYKQVCVGWGEVMPAG